MQRNEPGLDRAGEDCVELAYEEEEDWKIRFSEAPMNTGYIPKSNIA